MTLLPAKLKQAGYATAMIAVGETAILLSSPPHP